MHRAHASVSLALCLLAACADPPDDPQADADASSDEASTAAADSTSEGAVVDPEVTYWRDIKPLLDARCGACHTADGVAPFSFDTYADAAVYAPAMMIAIDNGTMPPWPAADDCTEYLFDPTLDAAQIDAVRTWVELGAPEGDPATEGEPLPLARAELPRIDFEIAMADEHTPQLSGGELDEHRCFILEWPETEQVYVRGYEVIPGNRKIVHHLVARVVAPNEIEDLEASDAADPAEGWACGAGEGMSGGGGPLLGVWVPGSGASIFPENTGLPIESGSKVMLNMHYNIASGDTAPDRTRVTFMVEDEVELEGRSVFISDPTWPVGDNMLIEAGDAESVHTFDFELPLGAVDVHMIGLHMHTLGVYGSMVVERADGSTACGLDIPRWDFDWQLGYQLVGPLTVNVGDRVRLQCAYDNSAANQPLVDGVPREPTDVTWGEDSLDEMCLGYVYVTRR
jgi:mono/diheme cytochrome c family protein